MTPNTFNLATDNWIKVLPIEGQLREVSLLHLLDPANADQFILAGDQLNIAATVRLIAGLGFQARKQNVSAHQLVQQQEARFNLFGDQPFWQDRHLSHLEPEPVPYLELDGAAGKKLVYGNRYGSERHTLTFAQAARLLVRAQPFTNGTRLRIKSTFPGMTREDSMGHTPASTERLLIHPAPTATVAQILQQMVVGWEDTPLDEFNYSWDGRRVQPRPSKGPADSYSFLNRRILLFPDNGVVTGVITSKGETAQLTGKVADCWLPDGCLKSDGKTWFRGNSARSALSSLSVAAEALVQAQQDPNSWVAISKPDTATVVAFVTETQTPNAVVHDVVCVAQASGIIKGAQITSKIADACNNAIRVAVSGAFFTPEGESAFKNANTKTTKDLTNSSYSATAQLQTLAMEYLSMGMEADQSMVDWLSKCSEAIVANRATQLDQEKLLKALDKSLKSGLARANKALLAV